MAETLIPLEIGITISKPAQADSGKESKTQYACNLDGQLIVVTVENSLVSKIVKDNKVSVPLMKIVKGQKLVLLGGKGESYPVATYVSLKA